MPKNILKEIIAYKEHILLRRKSEVPLEVLCRFLDDTMPASRFSEAILKEGVHLIAELKKASPSAGVIRPDFDAGVLARLYEKAGATCLSVLTEDKYFQGSLACMDEARAASTLPVLRKDFIIDEYQIYESKAHGADAVLLIVSILDKKRLHKFLMVADNLNLDAVIEVHTPLEVKTALAVGARIIGINARSLKKLTVDLNTLSKIKSMIPEDRLVICESGVKTIEDLAFVKALRPQAVLIGEGLMRQEDLFTATEQFVHFLKNDDKS